jgi:hypothetical protein
MIPAPCGSAIWTYPLGGLPESVRPDPILLAGSMNSTPALSSARHSLPAVASKGSRLPNPNFRMSASLLRVRHKEFLPEAVDMTAVGQRRNSGMTNACLLLPQTYLVL